MNFYTLDTNVVAAVLRGEARVMSRLEAAISAGNLVTINAMSYYETRRGLLPKHSRKRMRFDTLKQEAGILELDEAGLDIAATIYQRLRRSGTLIEDADILIAAIALANDATLVTRNTKHFERIEELKLENWEA